MGLRLRAIRSGVSEASRSFTMLNPESGRAWFQVAIFFTIIPLILLVFERPGTAEFVITVTTLLIGLIFLGVVILFIRRSNR